MRKSIKGIVAFRTTNHPLRNGQLRNGYFINSLAFRALGLLVTHNSKITVSGDGVSQKFDTSFLHVFRLVLYQKIQNKH